MIVPTRVAVIVQARMSSTRLPGKVLRPLAGAPAIVRMMERVGRVTQASHRLVATSEERTDDELAAVCVKHGLRCVRGPLDDVLGRFVRAIPPGCDVVVRLTGDCPLVDPALVDLHIDRFAGDASGAQYVTNTVEGQRTYPEGLDVEVVSRAVLEEANQHATSAYDREHVTPWVRQHARTASVREDVDLSSLRWVLDTEEDYRFLARVYDVLYPTDPHFDGRAVCRWLLAHPEWIHLERDRSREEAIKAMRDLLCVEASQ